MLLLQNGRVIDPKSGLDQVMDLVTGNGKILELGNDLKEKYPDAYACASRIKTYLDAKLGVELTHEEMLYFMLHIRRLTEREKSQA